MTTVSVGARRAAGCSRHGKACAHGLDNFHAGESLENEMRRPVFMPDGNADETQARYLAGRFALLVWLLHRYENIRSARSMSVSICR